MAIRQQLSERAKQLADEIRQWCKSQVHLWQQLPNLALEADGRTGFSDNLNICYNRGLWRLWDNSHLVVSVDCETGRLINERASDHSKELTDASDDAVLWLALRLDLIDAAGIIGRLTDQCQQQRPNYYSEEVWRQFERRRSEIRARLGLGYGNPYTRRQQSAA